jgi:hypothetical protein
VNDSSPVPVADPAAPTPLTGRRPRRVADNPPPAASRPKKTRIARTVKVRPVLPGDPPLAAKKPLRFERGELQLHLLRILLDRGPQRRPPLTASAFTTRPTTEQRRRINCALGQLLEKGYVQQLGEVRLFTFRLTPAGKAFLRKLAKARGDKSLGAAASAKD